MPIDQNRRDVFALKRRGVLAMMIGYADQPRSISGNWNNVHRMINGLQWWNTYMQRKG